MQNSETTTNVPPVKTTLCTAPRSIIPSKTGDDSARLVDFASDSAIFVIPMTSRELIGGQK